MPKDSEYKFTFEGDDLEEQEGADATGEKPALPDVTNDDNGAGNDDPEIVFVDEEPDPAKARAGVQADDDQALAPLPDEGAAPEMREDPRVAAMAERMAQMEALLGKRQQNDVEAQIATHDARHAAAVAAAQAKIEAGLEAGDTKATAAAQVELARATQAEALHKVRVDQWRASQQQEQQRAPAPQEQQRTQQPAPAFDQKALQSWLTKNQWFHDQSGKYARHQQLAKTIDEQVMADGFNPGHPKYYTELSTRLREAMKGKDPGNPKQPGQTPVASTSRGGASGGGGGGTNGGGSGKRIVLTQDDRKMMETLRIDTSNPKEVAAFAAAKAERIRNEARQSKTR